MNKLVVLTQSTVLAANRWGNGITLSFVWFLGVNISSVLLQLQTSINFSLIAREGKITHFPEHLQRDYISVNCPCCPSASRNLQAALKLALTPSLSQLAPAGVLPLWGLITQCRGNWAADQNLLKLEIEVGFLTYPVVYIFHGFAFSLCPAQHRMTDLWLYLGPMYNKAWGLRALNCLLEDLSINGKESQCT